MILNTTKFFTRILTGFLFIALTFIGVNAQSLKGQWKLVEMTVDGARFDLTADNTPTLIFGEELRVSGNAGCNRYSTTYDENKKTVDFKPFISTKMACTDQKRNSQEAKYFVAFDKVSKFKMSKKALSLSDEGKKNVLKFVPIDSKN